MRPLVEASTLPMLEVDVSDGDVPGAADRIADWLVETDGLTAPRTSQDEAGHH